MMIGPRKEAIAEAQAKISTAEAVLALSEAKLEYLNVRSPIEGVVEDLLCHPGQTIAAGAEVAQVVDTSQVLALVWLPARSAAQVKAGQKAVVKPSSSAMPTLEKETGHSPSEELEGEVEFVGRIADAQTGNLPIHVLISNPNQVLSLGEMVTVEVIVEEKPNQLLVPSVAISDQGEGPVLSIIREGKSVLLHPQLGSTHDGWTAVSGVELKPGELVITEGGYNLPEGTEVEIEKEEDHDEKGGKKESDAKGEEHEKEEKAEAGKDEKPKEKGEAPAPKPKDEEARTDNKARSLAVELGGLS